LFRRAAECIFLKLLNKKIVSEYKISGGFAVQYENRYRIINNCFPSGFSVAENINKIRTVYYPVIYGDAARFSENQENMHCAYVRPYRKYKLSFCAGTSVCLLREGSSPSIKNGLTIDIRNTDGGTVCGQTYKDISSCSINGGYEICFGDAVAVSFEVEKGNVSRVQYGVSAESLEYYILFGPTTKKILERYTELPGRPALPPKGTFGLCLPASFSVLSA
jgi:alpha-glucosidase (family GH31 glycosyl hydrolase)